MAEESARARCVEQPAGCLGSGEGLMAQNSVGVIATIKVFRSICISDFQGAGESARLN